MTEKIEGTPENTDYGFLLSPNEYGNYFRTLQKCCGRFSEKYSSLLHGGKVDEQFEKAAIAVFTDRVLATATALHMRYGYLSQGERPLYVDFSDSGFPNYHEISKLESDCELALERLGKLPAMPVLKRKLIDSLMRGDAEPTQELALLRERRYFEMVSNPEKLLLTFSGGSPELLGNKGERRVYAYSWSSYDPMSNLPCLYVMQFEQSFDHPRLESPGTHQEAFMAKIRTEGSRSSPLVLMAVGIDELEGIYPKVLKRLTIGPLFSSSIFDARNQDALTDRERIIHDLLGATEKDAYILIGSAELAISIREEETRSFQATLGLRKGVRQVFQMPEEDPILTNMRASALEQYALLSHNVAQLLSTEIRREVPELGSNVLLFPFNQKGDIQDVGFPERNTD